MLIYSSIWRYDFGDLAPVWARPPTLAAAMWYQLMAAKAWPAQSRRLSIETNLEWREVWFVRQWASIVHGLVRGPLSWCYNQMVLFPPQLGQQHYVHLYRQSIRLLQRRTQTLQNFGPVTEVAVFVLNGVELSYVGGTLVSYSRFIFNNKFHIQ